MFLTVEKFSVIVLNILPSVSTRNKRRERVSKRQTGPFRPCADSRATVPQPPPPPPSSHWTQARPFYRRLRRIFMSYCNGPRRGGDGPKRRETGSLGFSPYTYTYNAPNTRAVLLRAIKSQSRVNLPDRLFKTFYAR